MVRQVAGGVRRFGILSYLRNPFMSVTFTKLARGACLFAALVLSALAVSSATARVAHATEYTMSCSTSTADNPLQSEVDCQCEATYGPSPNPPQYTYCNCVCGEVACSDRHDRTGECLEYGVTCACACGGVINVENCYEPVEN